MSTALVEEFRSNPERSRRLADLMNMCRDGYRVVTVLVVGAGDAFINRYWPKLQLLVNTGRVKLTVVDREPVESLIEKKLHLAQESGEQKSAQKLKELYGDLQRMLKEQPGEVKYLNSQDPQDRSWYEHLTQDIVFVLVPDDIHIKYAGHWLKRATLVVVEKPYNRDLVEAMRFEDVLNSIISIRGNAPHTYVVCIDHYLAKIFRYVMRRHEEALEAQVGVIQRIEFSICETGGVEPWRAASLDAGMIYDLFCHLLAQICPFVDLGTFLHGDESRREILIAQHERCPQPFNGESYASIRADLRDFNNRRVTLTGCVGKGVGNEDLKFLKIIGENGILIGDFGPRSDGKISLDVSGARRPLFEIGKGHAEMLDAIFEGRFVEEPVGGLTGETAILILQILTSIRNKIERHGKRFKEGMGIYPIGASPEDISKLAIRLE